MVANLPRQDQQQLCPCNAATHPHRNCLHLVYVSLTLGVLVLFSHTTRDSNRAKGHAWLSPKQFSVWCSSDSPSSQNQTVMGWCQLNTCCQNAELQTQALLFMHQEAKHPSSHRVTRRGTSCNCVWLSVFIIQQQQDKPICFSSSFGFLLPCSKLG